MAIDLRTMLGKVLGSGGEKKYFFAYGVGKRKDKKGEGDLAVGGQKPKKAEIEGELDGCKEVLEGVCWVGKGKNDSETLYFQCKGKKIAGIMVTKMTLTAKLMTSRQYDFQLPSPEEEARAAHLKEGDGDEGHSEQAVTSPVADKKVVEPKAGTGTEVPAALHKQLLLALQTWRAASDSVDSQITALAAVLRKKEDEDLQDIADKGLNALTGNFKVHLMTLLHVAASAKGPALRQIANEGLPIAQDFLEHINSDERVAVCDDNPFGVKVSIRQTLGGALSDLGKAFQEVCNA